MFTSKSAGSTKQELGDSNAAETPGKPTLRIARSRSALFVDDGGSAPDEPSENTEARSSRELNLGPSGAVEKEPLGAEEAEPVRELSFGEPITGVCASAGRKRKLPGEEVQEERNYCYSPMCPELESFAEGESGPIRRSIGFRMAAGASVCVFCIGLLALAARSDLFAGFNRGASEDASGGLRGGQRSHAPQELYADVDVLYTELAGEGHQDNSDSAEQCRFLCQGEPACQAFTWVVDAHLPFQNPGQCWLKGGTFVQAMVKIGVFSAFLRDANPNAMAAANKERQRAAIDLATSTVTSITMTTTVTKSVTATATFTTTKDPYAGVVCRNMEPGMDYEYSHMAGVGHIDQISSPEQCCRECKREKTCRAFTWVQDVAKPNSGQCRLNGGEFINKVAKRLAVSAFTHGDDSVTSTLTFTRTTLTSTTRSATYTTAIVTWTYTPTTTQMILPGGPTTTTQDPCPIYGSGSNLHADVDVRFTYLAGPGHVDYIGSAEQCCEICKTEPTCQAFSWVKDANLPGHVKGQCWMKGGKFVSAQLQRGVYTAFIRGDNVKAKDAAKELEYLKMEEAGLTFAPTTTGTITTTTPDPCPGRGAGCLEEKCCSDAGFQCMTKSPYWAQCMEECRPGPNPVDEESDEPWECEALGKRKPGKPPKCAAEGDNCIDYMCCQTSGLQCYAKNATFGACGTSCESGWSCEQLGGQAPSIAPWVSKTCAQEASDCSQTRCCAQPGTQCYRMNKDWSQCIKSCEPGMQQTPEEPPWSCEPLGMRTPEAAAVAVKA